MAWTRSAIEQVLRKHELPQGCNLIMKNVGLVDDLLACYPQPSRDELEKILFDKTLEELHTGITRQDVLDRVMAWAQGQEIRQKEWCSHCQWFLGDNGGRWLFDKSFEVKWKRPVPAWCLIPIPEDCDNCPVCAQPRPADA